MVAVGAQAAAIYTAVGVSAGISGFGLCVVAWCFMRRGLQAGRQHRDGQMRKRLRGEAVLVKTEEDEDDDENHVVID